MEATIVQGKFIHVGQEADYLTADCTTPGEFKALPKIVEYDGIRYGLSGWDSDRNRAYYKRDAVGQYARATP